MTARTKRINGHVTKWQKRLRLENWDIRYNPEGKPDLAEDACIQWQAFLRYAEIHIQPDIPDSELEACVVHELLHIAIKQLSDLSRRWGAEIGGKRGGIVNLELEHALSEELIETLTMALLDRRQLVHGKVAERMPLFSTEAA